ERRSANSKATGPRRPGTGGAAVGSDGRPAAPLPGSEDQHPLRVVAPRMGGRPGGRQGPLRMDSEGLRAFAL
ncbi:MAG: hypothetical protein AVDCRST_MAG56-1143, partial [uncultured Cytophagales bacterium]